jgi:GTP cyclohydrolase I
LGGDERKINLLMTWQTSDSLACSDQAPGLLPDPALEQTTDVQAPLEWAGMQGIDLPVFLGEPKEEHPVHARTAVYVNLPDPHVRGIHMSRLYQRMDRFAAHERLTPDSLRALLIDLVRSHTDCGSTRAKTIWEFALLRRRPALITEGLGGWQAYPVRLSARWERGAFSARVAVTVTYSSTCPCSAALSRRVVMEAFLAEFGALSSVPIGKATEWLQSNGSLATPHSQRSVATISVALTETVDSLGLGELIDRIEAALGTPVQTAVKRLDEQAFARNNGENLMFVEDAARRIERALKCSYADLSIQVRHLESLHPHDAVAETGGSSTD